MEISFTHHGQKGRVVAAVEPTLAPGNLGVGAGAIGLANCKATIEFSAGGYLGLLGWVLLSGNG